MIDDMFCSEGNLSPSGECNSHPEIYGACKTCFAFKHKWPSPKQYKKEYGKEYPEDGAVYMRQVDIDDPSHTGGWHSPCFGYRDARSQNYSRSIIEIVCACTPWGKPPDNWRPE